MILTKAPPLRPPLLHPPCAQWFINQRKRHWTKLFGADIPKTESEARVAITRIGITRFQKATQ